MTLLRLCFFYLFFLSNLTAVTINKEKAYDVIDYKSIVVVPQPNSKYPLIYNVKSGTNKVSISGVFFHDGFTFWLGGLDYENESEDGLFATNETGETIRLLTGNSGSLFSLHNRLFAVVEDVQQHDATFQIVELFTLNGKPKYSLLKSGNGRMNSVLQVNHLNVILTGCINCRKPYSLSFDGDNFVKLDSVSQGEDFELLPNLKIKKDSK